MRKMRTNIRPIGLALLVAATCLTAAPAALADSVQISGEGHGVPGGVTSFTGVLDYQADSLAEVGLLTIELTNTGDVDSPAFITGFLFNIGSNDDSASATLLDSPPPSHPFEQYSDPESLDGSPFGGPFDAGAGLAGSFPSDEDPTGGIAVGETGVFTFQINASDAGSLSAIDFIEGGDFDYNFIVRFIALTGAYEPVPASVVPLPAPVTMGVAGLAGVVLASRRNRSKTKSRA